MCRKTQKFANCHGGPTHGQTTCKRPIMGTHRTSHTKTSASTQRRQTASKRPQGLGGNNLCAQNRYPLAVSAQGNGLWFRHDLLAAIKRLAKSWSLGQNIPYSPQASKKKRQDRLFSCDNRLGLSASRFWGAKTGPNATDRRKLGSKHHVITDANGIPFAVKVTGANRHDITQLLPLVESIPPIAGATF